MRVNIIKGVYVSAVGKTFSDNNYFKVSSIELNDISTFIGNQLEIIIN